MIIHGNAILVVFLILFVAQDLAHEGLHPDGQRAEPVAQVVADSAAVLGVV